MTFRERVGKFLDFIRRRKHSYQITAVNEMTVDLARFCYAYGTTFHQDPLESARRQGRREVWLRIEEHLKLPAQQLVALYSEGKLILKDGD